MEKHIWLNIIALSLVTIGALNWGLIGFFKYDLISTLIGSGVARVIFAIVGIAGIYAVYWEALKIKHHEL